MTTPTGMAGVFDRAADTYDAVGVEWFGPIAAGLVAELAAQPGERVLDVGCGRGAALLRLAQAVGPTGHVLGIDLAPRMIAATSADVQGLPHVEVRVGDATSPDLPPESYDVVASCLVLFFLPDPAGAVRAWAHLLVHGGRMGITTFGPQDERWKPVDDLFTPYLPPSTPDPRARGRGGPFASDEGMERLLAEAGLVEVRTAHRTVRASFANAQQWLDFSWSHGQRAMWEAVPEEERDDVRQRAFALLEGFGDMSFTQDVRHTLGRRP